MKASRPMLIMNDNNSVHIHGRNDSNRRQNSFALDSCTNSNVQDILFDIVNTKYVYTALSISPQITAANERHVHPLWNLTFAINKLFL